ncbi:MAG TPA: tyrosine-type recombinase/integrase, partial [Candidatus Wallbacteria bacterium]|nr:tyrosine-type recombinase/integrase [Candidatus Wallbacteria bacterium]
MPIYNFCKKCKSTFALIDKKCKKCGHPVQRQGRTYRIVVKSNHKVVTQTIPNSLERAREIEAKIKTEMVDGEYFDRRKATHTIDEVWQKYLESYKARGKAWHKEELRYNCTLKGKFGKRTLASITPFEVEKYITELRKTMTKFKKPYSPKSIVNIIDLMGVLYNYAIKFDLYDGENPCNKVKRPKINNLITNILNIDQTKRMLKTLSSFEDQKVSNLIRFLLFTGIRRGEAFKLEWKDINFSEGRIILRDPKGGRDEHIFLNESALKI